MNEFKGTKGRLAVKEAIGHRNELLYYHVQHKGNSIADFSPNPYTEIPTSLESAKANAVLFSKATEMLRMLTETYLQIYALSKRIQDETYKNGLKGRAESIKKLIKEATEI
jgi:hypothetical protein